MTRLINAKLRLQRAREACPHWDNEAEFDSPMRECCQEVAAASVALGKARKATLKGEA